MQGVQRFRHMCTCIRVFVRMFACMGEQCCYAKLSVQEPCNPHVHASKLGMLNPSQYFTTSSTEKGWL